LFAYGLAGFGVAVLGAILMGLAIMLRSPPPSGSSLAPAAEVLRLFFVVPWFLLIPGAIGAMAAVAFWTIARPDKPA
jgi:hypothetical protein